MSVMKVYVSFKGCREEKQDDLRAKHAVSGKGKGVKQDIGKNNSLPNRRKSWDWAKFNFKIVKV